MWKEHLAKITPHQSIVFDEISFQCKAEELKLEPTECPVEQWLAQRLLLVDIPFQYLIPSPSMLPNNTIRFFYINNNWLTALIDGACSIGRDSSMDTTHDKAVLSSLLERARKYSKSIRPRLQERELNLEMLTNPVSQAGGFLLRSPLVRGWRGLQFRGFNREGEIIEPLRIETVSDDVLIALYDELPFKVEIAQPPEGLYFGVNLGSEEHEKAMRDFATGKIIEPNLNVSVPLKNKAYRTVDVLKTRQNIAQKFQRSEQEITSAEFALQMIKSPYKGVISINE